ncbi:MAG: serine/threonine protein kinase [Planctomycetes bacterium]|nr:serine/threonine protein kinase [Planctomycetota bacterium]
MVSSRIDAAPTSEELKAYSEGRLETSRFDAVDRWIAAQSPEVQERVLSSDDSAGVLSGAAEMFPAGTSGPFSPDTGTGRRFSAAAPIGAGGMGIVDLLRDQVLGRDIVVKRCRPRRPDEAVATYLRRIQLFKREAQLTAQLEHPGIVPVHDVGEGPLGEPAFTMKRLEGEPLSAIIARRRAGEGLDVARLVEVILRVADAVGYAHSRGVVHRDLKPDNIIVGALGAVYVIDWGLAGVVGTVPTRELVGASPSTISGMGMGTPAWMAPEQFGQVKADPRMDVFAIGGLLMATLSGKGPRDRGVSPGSPEVNLAPLDARLPRGLVAVARRCLQVAPEKRYADASAVADDLRQWLAAGLTSAENPGRLTRLVSAMRRSRRLSAALIGIVAAAVFLVSYELWREHRRRDAAIEALDRIRAEATPLADAARLRDARKQVQEILVAFPGLAQAQALEASIGATYDDLERKHRQATLTARIQALTHAFVLKGEWPTQIPEMRAALRACGIALTPGSDRADRAAVIASATPRADLLTAIALLERACVVGGVESDIAARCAQLIADTAPDAAWAGVARLLASTSELWHDLALADDPEALAAATGSARTADLVLALFGPQPRLIEVASTRLRENPGAFWPHVIAGRVALQRGDYSGVERNALVALGKEPQSVWPRLLLAYVHLDSEYHAGVLTSAVEGLSINPDNRELLVLRAVGMCGLGLRSEAQDLINRSDCASLLRYHLYHQEDHPIERGISALVAQGIIIPPADPLPGPLVVPVLEEEGG